MIVNLTGHRVTVVDVAGNVVYDDPGDRDRVARVAETRHGRPATPGTVPVVRVDLGDLVGLPEPQEGVTYVVSLMAAVKAAADGRVDVYAPGPTSYLSDGRRAARWLKEVRP